MEKVLALQLSQKHRYIAEAISSNPSSQRCTIDEKMYIRLDHWEELKEIILVDKNRAHFS